MRFETATDTCFRDSSSHTSSGFSWLVSNSCTEPEGDSLRASQIAEGKNWPKARRTRGPDNLSAHKRPNNSAAFTLTSSTLELNSKFNKYINPPVN